MAHVNYLDPVRDIRGTFQRGGIINRRKQYCDDKGRIVNESAPEAYAVRHPRDWKKNPATAKELENQNRFKAASAEAYRILHAVTPEDLALLSYWQTRFRKQLRRPEPDAPFDPQTGKRKRYSRLDAFIRTCLMREMQ